MNEYEPSEVSHPGTTLRDTLDSFPMTVDRLSMLSGISHQTIRGILGGAEVISEEAAKGFEFALGIPASFWISRDRRYQESLSKKGK